MTLKRRSTKTLIALCVVLLPFSAFAQRNARTVSTSLDQMVQQAETIVHGNVVSTKIEPHPELRNLTTALVTMNVTTILKGKQRKSLQFRQYIWDADTKGNGEYRKGEELVLLLGPVSQYGLTSPVGLDQGLFRITHDRKGQAVAVNGRGNVGLFSATEQHAQAQTMKLSARTLALARQQKAGPLALTDLKEAIRNFAEKK